MKKMESTLTNMIVVLVGVALVTGCLLAVVNHITEGPKAAQKTLALAEGIRTVMGNSDVTVSKTDTVCMTVNGKPAKASYDVKVGDHISIAFGARTVTVEVLAVAEAVRKDDATAMSREV